MAFLEWIEGTALAEYILVGAYGYPAMITLHSFGLAVMVGLSSVLSLRVLGYFEGLPTEALPTFFRIAWVGFLVNLVSGTLLFASQATTYVTDVPFLVKMSFVLLGAIFVVLMQGKLRQMRPVSSPAPQAGSSRALAAAVLVSWVFAMIVGRLIAYT